MEKSFSKRLIVLFFAITMLILPNASFAATKVETVAKTNVEPRLIQWTYLHCCENGLMQMEDAYRTLAIYASTEVYTDGDGTAVSAQLQKLSSNGLRWDDVDGKYWEADSDNIYCSVSADDVRVSAGTYRLYVEHHALDPYGYWLESFEAYSEIVTVY